MQFISSNKNQNKNSFVGGIAHIKSSSFNFFLFNFFGTLELGFESMSNENVSVKEEWHCDYSETCLNLSEKSCMIGNVNFT